MHVSGGVLEDMFNGVGFEYLKHDIVPNVSVGAEHLELKRDYEYDFEMLDYMKTTGHLISTTNLVSLVLLQNFRVQYLPVMKAQHLRFGKDLEMELKWEPMLPLQMYLLMSMAKAHLIKVFLRYRLLLGTKSFTNFGWKPLTKDPAAKLNKAYELYNEMLRFE